MPRLNRHVLSVLIVVVGLVGTFCVGRWTQPAPDVRCYYCEGRLAAKAGMKLAANPYLVGDDNRTPEGLAWTEGWNDARTLQQAQEEIKTVRKMLERAVNKQD
jgi:hypothetical protein